MNYSFSKTPARLFLNRLSTRSYSCKILGIETSCDDTGVAIVDNTGQVLGECLASQQRFHSELGGIIPPFAKQLHQKNINNVLNEALKNAKLALTDIDAIAVTIKPGLLGSLAVGLSKAIELSLQARKPLIPIHHMEAHALTIRMIKKVDFPFLVLLISGGHCLIAVAQDVDRFILLGQTTDDAPGEAYDKVARRLKLFNLPEYFGMSGGRAIELAALKGNSKTFNMTEPLLRSRNCDFSFSGIKNSARAVLLREESLHGTIGDQVLPSVNDICASFQLVVAKHLCRRILRAMEFAKVNNLIPGETNLVVSGGVACNKYIGNCLHSVCNEVGYKCHIPPVNLCTDNGIMIAWNGVEKFITGKGIVSFDDLDKVDVQARSPLGTDMTKEVEAEEIKVSWTPIKILR